MKSGNFLFLSASSYILSARSISLSAPCNSGRLARANSSRPEGVDATSGSVRSAGTWTGVRGGGYMGRFQFDLGGAAFLLRDDQLIHEFALFQQGFENILLSHSSYSIARFGGSDNGTHDLQLFAKNLDSSLRHEEIGVSHFDHRDNLSLLRAKLLLNDFGLLLRNFFLEAELSEKRNHLPNTDRVRIRLVEARWV